jgi:DNA-directed RNA polymerase specialized sigma24 family protein
MLDEVSLGKFMLFIDKATKAEIKDRDFVQYREDVAQDAFLKLYRSGYLSENSIETEDDVKRITAYIRMTVKSCYTDFLTKNGIIRRSTKTDTELKYDQIQYDRMDDPDTIFSLEDHQAFNHHKFNARQLYQAKQAYDSIAYCFQKATETIKEKARRDFYQIVFWDLEDHNMSIKELAAHMGFINSNPTQDFNRFVQKVSDCTEKDGYKIVDASEQINFLKQILSLDEAV